ncbi:hypothetical protein KJ762_15950 [bacterium]|nr:hypothetical protein [bacterium]MBU1635978.1 hypothetical protein [bacterium]MBU1873677.1 hypothetical protein [bacterium]
MKPKIMIVFFLIILTICANASTKNSSKFLKTGTGIYFINDMVGPVLITEFGYSLTQNLLIVPRLLISAAIGDNEYPKSSTYNSYYDLGLGLQYRFSSMERLKLGFGGNMQLMMQVYLREYEDIHDDLVRNIASVFDFFCGFYGSADYAVIQGKNIDFGVDGIVQFGEYNSYTVAIYMKFKS